MTLPYRTVLKTQAVTFACLLFAFAAPSFAAEFKANAIGQLDTVKVSGDETLIDMAEAQQVGYAQLLAANPGVDPWLPGNNRTITLPNWHILPDTVHNGLVLNVGELRMYYFPADGSAPKTFPIGIGREGLKTPQGTTTITRKAAAPTWRPTPRMRLENPELPAEVKAGPENPLGAYALYLGWPSYLLHGTDKPKAVGRRASSGCIRMYAPHIEWLFKNVPVGTKVTSVDQPVKMAWLNNELYIEAEPSDLQIDEIEYKNRQVTVEIPDGMIGQIRAKAGDQVGRVDWERVRTALVQRTGIPTQITGKPQAAPVKKQEVVKQEEAAKPVAKKPRNDWDNLNQ